MGTSDSIFKENIEHIFSYFRKVLGITIKEVRELKDKVHTTMVVRETDFLKKVVDTQGHEFILHLEFQSANDSEMVYRMAEYKALLQRKYRMTVHQFVIYLGVPAPTMDNMLPEDRQITGFKLINIRELPVETALHSDIPEEIILAILTNYQEADTGEVIRQIIEKLQRATSDESHLRRVLQQLLTLSRLRNLDEEIEKQLKDMPITFDITKDRLYNKGMEQGIMEGERRGIMEGERRGIMEGERRGKIEVAELMIRGGEPVAKIARFTGLSIRDIERLKREKRK